MRGNNKAGALLFLVFIVYHKEKKKKRFSKRDLPKK
jgi:hypothetical protein